MVFLPLFAGEEQIFSLLLAKGGVDFFLPFFQGEGWGGVRLLGFEARPKRPPLNLPLGRGRSDGFSPPFCRGGADFLPPSCEGRSRFFPPLFFKGRVGVGLGSWALKQSQSDLLSISPLAGGGVMVFLPPLGQGEAGWGWALFHLLNRLFNTGQYGINVVSDL